MCRFTNLKAHFNYPSNLHQTQRQFSRVGRGRGEHCSKCRLDIYLSKAPKKFLWSIACRRMKMPMYRLRNEDEAGLLLNCLQNRMDSLLTSMPSRTSCKNALSQTTDFTVQASSMCMCALRAPPTLLFLGQLGRTRQN